MFYEILLKNKIINSDIYCDQLDKLNTAIQEKHSALVNYKDIIFHHDNTKLHISL
jgi:hypothetical protein